MKSPALCVVILAGLLTQTSISSANDKELTEILNTLGRQIMLQKLYTEEVTRSTYASGLKQMRRAHMGTRSYDHETWQGKPSGSIHNHANYKRTMGIGEFEANLNGVEFRTRHNDYLLRMKSRTKKTFNLVEDIPLPSVPTEVLRLTSVRSQIAEMRKWFKAWKDQDYSKRDYRKYFKPVLCYLEGSWIYSGEAIEEPFESERHHLDAETWYDMQERIRYTAMSGTKDLHENYSFLPTMIVRMDGRKPVIAQWNYRILCHPLKNDLPLNRFRPILDESQRRGFGTNTDHGATDRGLRFQINAFDTDRFKDGQLMHQLLDTLMAEIPGKDNYPAQVPDDSFGRDAREMNGERTGAKTLNAGYYHRGYSDTKEDASGHLFRLRSFNDHNIFMARTTNPKVPAIEIDTNCEGTGKNRKCVKSEARWSYAVPLEIVYTTPLSNWNPHKIEYKGDDMSPLGLTVKADGRDGSLSFAKAFNGSSSMFFLNTPAEFYGTAPCGETTWVHDPADTSVKRALGVLKSDGRSYVANYYSGHTEIMADIPEVGCLRQRFPIYPIAYDGNPIMKEVHAIRDQLK